MYRSGAVVLLGVVGVACADDEAADPEGRETVATEPSTTATAAPTTAATATAAPTTTARSPEGSTTVPGPPVSAEPLYAAGDIDGGLQPFIDQAADDLAARLGVERDEISTHAAVLVVWPDTSLGCPQPDMRYAQVPTDGSVIELDHGGAVYRYHTGGERGPFLCEQPITKAPPGESLSAGGGIDD